MGFRDIKDACQSLDRSNDSDGRLNLTIFLQGHEIELPVGTDVRDGNGTSRAISWCGCIVQDPYPAARTLGFLPEEGHGVYVARWCHGSPVHRCGLYALQWKTNSLFGCFCGRHEGMTCTPRCFVFIMCVWKEL